VLSCARLAGKCSDRYESSCRQKRDRGRAAAARRCGGELKVGCDDAAAGRLRRFAVRHIVGTAGTTAAGTIGTTSILTSTASLSFCWRCCYQGQKEAAVRGGSVIPSALGPLKVFLLLLAASAAAVYEDRSSLDDKRYSPDQSTRANPLSHPQSHARSDDPFPEIRRSAEHQSHT
jgi:hypothetical protein